MSEETEGRRPNPVDLHVGGRVRMRRKLLGVSQEQLADSLGLTFQQIQKYEKGANRISASKLWDIARFFKVDIDYFFQGLADAQPGMAEGDAPAFQHDFPATRHTIEIARLVPALPVRKQKLVLEMVREMAGASGEDD